MKTKGKFPENLLRDVLGQDCVPESDMEATLEYMMATQLKDRDRRIVLLRYKDCMTLSAIGEQINLTRERIRQIIIRSLRILGYREKAEILRLGLNKWHLRKLEKMEQYAWERIRRIERREKAVARSVRLEEMGLSVRSYNCLYRNELNRGIKTAGDIADMTKMELSRVRYLGRKCFFEIEENLHSLGLKLADEPESDEGK